MEFPPWNPVGTNLRGWQPLIRLDKHHGLSTWSHKYWNSHKGNIHRVNSLPNHHMQLSATGHLNCCFLGTAYTLIHICVYICRCITNCVYNISNQLEANTWLQVTTRKASESACVFIGEKNNCLDLCFMMISFFCYLKLCKFLYKMLELKV